MLKRKRFLKQSLAVLLSLTLSLGPCAPVSFAAPSGEAGVEASVDAGSEAEPEEAADDTAEDNEAGPDEEASGEEASGEEASGEEQSDDPAAEEGSGSEAAAEAGAGSEEGADAADNTGVEDQNGAETTEENVTEDETGAADDDKSEAETGTDAETGADAETGTADGSAVSEETDPAGETAAETDPAGESAAETDPAGETPAETDETQPGSETSAAEGGENAAEVIEPETEAAGPAAETAETTEAAAAGVVMEESLEATVEDMQITVSYEKGVFPENVSLDVRLIDQESDDQMEIEGKVLKAFNRGAEEDESYSAVNTQALDIRILDADGKEVQPDTDKGKVYVGVSDIDRPLDQDGNAVPDNALHVFHMEDAGDEDAEELEKIETGEETLLSGDLLAAEGAVINDLNTQEAAEEEGEGAGEEGGTGEEALPETAAVTVEAEHFSLYVLAWKVGNKSGYSRSSLYDKNTYLIVSMIDNGDMLDDHGFDRSRGDKLNAVELISGADVISLNASDSDHYKWTVTTKKAGKAVFNVNYSTINGGKTATWVTQIKVEVKYFAEGTTSGTCGVNVQWSISGTKLTISGSGEMYNYTSPTSTSTGASVVPWVAYTKKITAVNIGAGVTSVGEYAFYQFEKLSSVTLPSGVEKIGKYAFYNAQALKSLTLPATLKKIENYAFASCDELGNITIPAGVTEIGEHAFYKQNLASNKAKNVITNNSSVQMRGLTEYNQNYSTCPTGIIEETAVDTDTCRPSIHTFEIISVTDRNAKYYARIKDRFIGDQDYALSKPGVELYVFVTTEDSITDPMRVLEGGERVLYFPENTTSESPTTVEGIPDSNYHYFVTRTSPDLFDYKNGETQLKPNTTYYAYAVAQDMYENHSDIVKVSFKTAAESKCLSPKVSLESGTYTGDQTVTLTPRTAGSTMYYKMSDLNSGYWTKYTAPFTLSASEKSKYTLYVYAAKAGLESSGTDTYQYTLIDPNAVMSGNCGVSGSNVTWKLIQEDADKNSSGDYTLELSGSGAMQNYSPTTVPWHPFRDRIRHIRIKNGVTTISDYAFHDHTSVEGELIIPDSVTSIGAMSFNNLGRVTTLKLGSGLKTIGDYALEGFDYVDVMTIPASVTSIGYDALKIYTYNGSGDKQQIINLSSVELDGDYPTEFLGHYNLQWQRVMSDSTMRPFVRRMYEVCLNRTADEGGLTYWTNRVLSGELKGIALAGKFVFGSEFTAKNYCDRHYVIRVYEALMGHAPDEAGLNYWVGRLTAGATREAVLNGIGSSNEYKNLCDAAGFVPGAKISSTKYGTKQYGPCAVCGGKSKVVQFAERMYTECLKRPADVSGLAYWTKGLYEQTISGRNIVRNFLLSSELKKQNLSNKEYVRRIYATMLGRSADADPSGLNYWTGVLDSGKTVDAVIDGFINSNEFTSLCNEAGIRRK